MGLLDDLEQERRQLPGPSGCIRLIKAQHPDLADELEQAIWAQDSSGRWLYGESALARQLKKRDIHLPKGSLKRHRDEKSCGCHRG